MPPRREMSQPGPFRQRLRAAWPVAVLLVLGASLASRSWRRWPDILVDFGNELYVPWRLTAGDVLYRDLFYVMGPASQYFNAFLFRLFGVSLTTLIFANLVILAAIVVLIYLLFVRVAQRWGATVICAVFLAAFAFAQYSGTGNYNYVCPYRHEMTHGICLCLAQIYCLVRCVEDRKGRWLCLAGLCSGLLATMKFEMLVASLGACATAGFIVVARSKPSPGALLRFSALFLGGAISPILICLVLLSTALPVGAAWEGLSRPWTLAVRPELTLDYPLFSQLMGMDAPVDGVTRIGVACLLLLLATLLALAIDAALSRVRHRQLVATILGIAAFSSAYLFVPLSIWLRMGFPLPVVVVIVGALSIFRALRSTDDEEFRRFYFLALWSALSGLLLVKMLLNVQLGHYGFVLAMPATLLLVYCGITALPAILEQRRGTGGMLRTIVLGVVAAWMCALWQRSDTIYRRKTEPFGAAGDVTYHDPAANYRSALMPAVLDDLETMLPTDATLMVLPYGIQLNYLLRSRNPTPYFLVTPWEMSAAGGEQRILDSMQAAPADFILIVDAEIIGHGFTRFGQPGYGADILEWIDRNYQLVRGHVGTNEPARAPFRALIYQRRPPASTD